VRVRPAIVLVVRQTVADAVGVLFALLGAAGLWAGGATLGPAQPAPKDSGGALAGLQIDVVAPVDESGYEAATGSR
jgi:hypothetical protein